LTTATPDVRGGSGGGIAWVATPELTRLFTEGKDAEDDGGRDPCEAPICSMLVGGYTDPFEEGKAEGR